MTVKWFVKYAC